MCIMSQKISEIAKQLNTPILQGSVSVSTAMEIMDMYDIDVIGIHCENDFAGVFSRDDFNRSVLRQNLLPDETTLYEAMPLNPPTINADQTIKDAYETMLRCHFKYVAVIDGKTLCGVVQMSDLGQDVIKSFLDAKSENELILHYIQTGESYAMADYKTTRN